MNNATSKRSRAAKLATGSLLAFAFMIVMNFLANYLPLNDISTGEISDKYYNIFTPAGFTFIIWGVIYISLALLLAFLIWGVFRGRERPVRIMSAVGWYFIASSLLNGIWIFTWHYEFLAVSLVVMFGLLLSLVLLYRSLRKSQVEEGGYIVPFSLYLGWVSVATFANIAIVTVAFNWGKLGLSGEFWFTVTLVAIIAIASYMITRMGDSVYGLVILWALSGITAARWADAGGSPSYAAFVTIAAAAIVFILLVIRQIYARS